jgi:excisionase family DNA binding protein
MKKADLDTPARRAYPMREASQMLSVSRSSLYRHADQGKIKFIRIGGRTLVPAAEIERLSAEGTQ